MVPFRYRDFQLAGWQCERCSRLEMRRQKLLLLTDEGDELTPGLARLGKSRHIDNRRRDRQPMKGPLKEPARVAP